MRVVVYGTSLSRRRNGIALSFLVLPSQTHHLKSGIWPNHHFNDRTVQYMKVLVTSYNGMQWIQTWCYTWQAHSHILVFLIRFSGGRRCSHCMAMMATNACLPPSRRLLHYERSLWMLWFIFWPGSRWQTNKNRRGDQSVCSSHGFHTQIVDLPIQSCTKRCTIHMKITMSMVVSKSNHRLCIRISQTHIGVHYSMPLDRF